MLFDIAVAAFNALIYHPGESTLWILSIMFGCVLAAYATDSI